jgi:hypothetical protein
MVRLDSVRRSKGAAQRRTPMTLFLRPLQSRPTAMPSAADMDVELWPAPKGS